MRKTSQSPRPPTLEVKDKFVHTIKTMNKYKFKLRYFIFLNNNKTSAIEFGHRKAVPCMKTLGTLLEIIGDGAKKSDSDSELIEKLSNTQSNNQMSANEFMYMSRMLHEAMQHEFGV